LVQYNKALSRRNLPPYVLGGVEEDPDLDWSYDGNGDPNVVPGTPEPVASSSSNHVGPTEEYWSGGTDTMATTGGGTKRGADSSSGSGSAPKRANTSLPGTGNEGAGDPDTGNPSPENAVIPRPISNTGGFTMVFRKVHTFISYGAAWKVVKHPGSNSAYFGTTSLMNVPVDQPWFYMSPSEFKVLPRGALCTSVRCRGVMRNPRTAFETNSSTSSLATLNQNKFMVKADGLNLSTRGVNRTLHFGNNTEPMDVTATEAYENHTLSYIEKMYGQTIDGQFKVSEGHCLPASYMNLPLMYNSYFCNFVNTGHNLGRMGWERFNEKITKVDASFTVGTTVVDYEYKPQCGLLTPQHDPFFDGLVSVQEPDTGAFHSFGLQNSNLEIIDDIDANSATVQRRTDNKLNHFGNTAWKRMFGNARYYTPIDCGQYVRQWDKNNHSSSVQPSVHVGVYPVHKLTTSTNSIVPVSFTDIECTWDFETEMTVSFGCPQSRVAFDRLHVEYEKSWMVPEDHFNQNMYYRGDLSVVHGKYVAPTKVSQPNASNTVTEKELTHGGTVRTLAQMNEANLDATTAAPSRKVRSTPDISGEGIYYKTNNADAYKYVHSKDAYYTVKDVEIVNMETTPTTSTSTSTTPVDNDPYSRNYDNPLWWPDVKSFQLYSSYLRFCHDLTVYRRNNDIPIVNQPVDFLDNRKNKKQN